MSSTNENNLDNKHTYRYLPKPAQYIMRALYFTNGYRNYPEQGVEKRE